jgi:hypothetical protein
MIDQNAPEFLQTANKFGIKLGLERMNALLSKLDHPEKDHSLLFQQVSDRLKQKMEETAEMLRNARKLKEENENDPFEMPVLRDNARNK